MTYVLNGMKCKGRNWRISNCNLKKKKPLKNIDALCSHENSNRQADQEVHVCKIQITKGQVTLYNLTTSCTSSKCQKFTRQVWLTDFYQHNHWASCAYENKTMEWKNSIFLRIVYFEVIFFFFFLEGSPGLVLNLNLPIHLLYNLQS